MLDCTGQSAEIELLPLTTVRFHRPRNLLEALWPLTFKYGRQASVFKDGGRLFSVRVWTSHKDKVSQLGDEAANRAAALLRSGDWRRSEAATFIEWLDPEDSRPATRRM